jgi:hypothetical protein
MDISLILSNNYVGSEWTLNGDDYSGLIWLDNSPKPTEDELQAQWAGVQYKVAYDAVIVARQSAYQQISDPIFFQYQRGEKTEQDWLDSVAAVNDANPYPVAPKAKK